MIHIGPGGDTTVRRVRALAEGAPVYNIEVAQTHTYFAGGDALARGEVLVHNTCFRGLNEAPGWRQKNFWGHTFSDHGHGPKRTRGLTGRAGGTGRQQGQWLDNDAAAQYIFEQAQSMDISTVTDVPIPEGLGQVILPDGSIVPATMARIVPNGRGGVTSTFPILGN